MPLRHKSRRETSTDHVGPHAVLAYPSDTAEAVLARIRHLQSTAWDLLCVIDRDEQLVGTLTAAELLALPGTAELGPAARRDRVSALPGTDQE